MTPFYYRYSDVFRVLASTVDLQIEALHILQAVWYDQSQMVVAISNYMSREGMLDPESIVLWAFSPSMSAFADEPDLTPPSSVHIRPQMLQWVTYWFIISGSVNDTVFSGDNKSKLTVLSQVLSNYTIHRYCCLDLIKGWILKMRGFKMSIFRSDGKSYPF